MLSRIGKCNLVRARTICGKEGANRSGSGAAYNAYCSSREQDLGWQYFRIGQLLQQH